MTVACKESSVSLIHWDVASVLSICCSVSLSPLPSLPSPRQSPFTSRTVCCPLISGTTPYRCCQHQRRSHGICPPLVCFRPLCTPWHSVEQEEVLRPPRIPVLWLLWRARKGLTATSHTTRENSHLLDMKLTVLWMEPMKAPILKGMRLHLVSQVAGIFFFQHNLSRLRLSVLL